MARDPYAGLDPTFKARLKAFIAASGGRISLFSGFRSVERQAQLWKAKLAELAKKGITGEAAIKAARKWVAPPGRSKHNHGLAGDLKFADEETKAWAHANAARFGLHFPMDHEDWHVEPTDSRSHEHAHTPAPGVPDDAIDVDGIDEEGSDRHDLGFQLANLASVLAEPVPELGGDLLGTPRPEPVA